MKKYLINKGHENIGPFDKEELKAQKINKETLVWTEDMEDWKKAGEVDELKAVLLSIPPPLKKATKENKVINSKHLLIASAIIIVLLFISNIVMSNAPQNITKPDDSQNRQIRNHITDLVQIRTNQYTIDGWGGITNLDIIVKNNTDYPLNNVTVAIDYIKENGGIFKTENLHFENIPPHQDKSLSAPDSNRGKSVTIKTQNISSTALNLCYDAANTPQVGNPDPFKCNQ